MPSQAPGKPHNTPTMRWTLLPLLLLLATGCSTTEPETPQTAAPPSYTTETTTPGQSATTPEPTNNNEPAPTGSLAPTENAPQPQQIRIPLPGSSRTATANRDTVTLIVPTNQNWIETGMRIEATPTAEGFPYNIAPKPAGSTEPLRLPSVTFRTPGSYLITVTPTGAEPYELTVNVP